MITKQSFPKKTAIVDGKEIKFSSVAEMEEFLVANWATIKFEPRDYTLTYWRQILSKVFGERDWSRNIRDQSYNTVNGGIASFSGEEYFEDCKVFVFGTESSGDAWSATDGKIKFRFGRFGR